MHRQLALGSSENFKPLGARSDTYCYLCIESLVARGAPGRYQGFAYQDVLGSYKLLPGVFQLKKMI